MERLRIDMVRLDRGTQPRVKLSQQQIRRYSPIPPTHRRPRS